MIEKIPPDVSKFLLCPMPGLLVALHVEEGEAIQPGQPGVSGFPCVAGIMGEKESQYVPTQGAGDSG